MRRVGFPPYLVPIVPTSKTAHWFFLLCVLLPLLSLATEDAFQIDALSDGSFRLAGATQPFVVHVTMQGATFADHGKGKDTFTLSLLQWGREGKRQAVKPSRIYSESNAVYLDYSSKSQTKIISEKFSRDPGGVFKQEFIVPVKPQGTGALHLQLHASGAMANTTHRGATIVLQSGRQLVYGQIVVTDASGNNIPSQLMVTKNNRMDIVVDDARAAYPLTIHPTLWEPDVVKPSMSVANAPSGAEKIQAKPGATIKSLPDDKEAHSTVKPSPEIIEAIKELRKPAAGDDEEIHHADGSVEIKLGNRFSSVPIATTGSDGKVHIDYHGEALVPEPSTPTPSQPAAPQKDTTGGHAP